MTPRDVLGELNALRNFVTDVSSRNDLHIEPSRLVAGLTCSCAKLALRAACLRMRTVPRQTVSDKSAERSALRNFATGDASPRAIPIAGNAAARARGCDAQPAAAASGRTAARVAFWPLHPLE